MSLCYDLCCMKWTLCIVGLEDVERYGGVLWPGRWDLFRGERDAAVLLLSPGKLCVRNCVSVCACLQVFIRVTMCPCSSCVLEFKPVRPPQKVLLWAIYILEWETDSNSETVSKPHYLPSLSNQNQFPQPLLFSSWAKIFSLRVCLMKGFLCTAPERQRAEGEAALWACTLVCVCVCVCHWNTSRIWDGKEQSTLT